MRFTPLLVLLVGCTVGLVDQTKPIEAYDTAVLDTAEEVDTDTDTEETDTDDTAPDIDENSENPWNGECGDNLDNDGDGVVDCNDPDCVAAPECNQSADGDTDGDGFRDEVDCDPYNPYVNPGATEVDNNGIDDDCDGVVDAGSNTGGGNCGNGGNCGTGGNPQAGTVCNDTCTDGFGGLLYGASDGTCQDGGFGDFISLAIGSSVCAFGTDCTDCGVRVDADGDFHEDDPLGLGLALYFDCNDSDPSINASATDIPGDGIDQDCDGSDASSGGTTTPTTETSCTNGIDDDQDGWIDCDDTDCSSDAACQTSTGGCSSTEIEDCNGNCAPDYWLGDGSCDDGSYSYSGNQIYLDCALYNNDDGDCTSGGGSTTETDCINFIDDDGDGDIDCADSDCASDPACAGSGGTGGTLCDDTCNYSLDGVCDDGGVNSSYSLCSFGTDCDDCGTRSTCDDTCSAANDGVCDDGGPNDSTSYQSVCDRGTDCADCGSY